MPEDRRIRFLVSPILLLFSLGWGMWLDCHWHPFLNHFFPENKSTSQGLTIIAGGGVVVFAFGVLIGTTTYALLRLLSICIRYFQSDGVKTHELYVTNDTLALIWKKLEARPPEEPDRSHFFAAMAFEHGILAQSKPKVHLWLARRWNAFSISATCFMGLVYSLLIGLIACIHLSFWWWFPCCVALLAFGLTARWSWRDTMGMLAFQARLSTPAKVSADTADALGNGQPESETG
jgi:hypothetical protein